MWYLILERNSYSIVGFKSSNSLYTHITHKVFKGLTCMKNEDLLMEKSLHKNVVSSKY